MADGHTRLNGWKDISSSLRRSVRTAQRWERDYGLPIHRQGPDGELIFAYRDELDAWIRSGKSQKSAPIGLQGSNTSAPPGVAPKPFTLGPHSLLLDDRAFPLRDGATIIGRADDADLQLMVPSVSRRHARILVCGDDATLEDLDSRHGSWRGAERVRGATRLVTGDEIRVGTVRLVYRYVRASETTA